MQTVNFNGMLRRLVQEDCEKRKSNLVNERATAKTADEREGLADFEEDVRNGETAVTYMELLINLESEARSWHEFHHGQSLVQCDSICKVIKKIDKLNDPKKPSKS